MVTASSAVPRLATIGNLRRALWLALKATSPAPASTTRPTGGLSVGGVPFAGASNMAERDIRWLATVRGRLGYAADRWLFYVTGGGAWGGVDYTAGPSYSGRFRPNDV